VSERRETYEEWKARYRAGHGMPEPGDIDIYRAFATENGVESEIVLVELPSGEDAAERRRELLVLCAEELPAYTPVLAREEPGGSDPYRPVVVELRRRRGGHGVFVGWMGAPPSAPSLTARELLRRAAADVRAQLAG
jgi:hypothetical protein